MRILFLSVWFPYPPDNGYKLRVYHLLKALGERHDVTLLSFAFEAAKAGDAAGYVRACEDVRIVERNPFERSSIAKIMRFLSPVPIVTLPVPEMSQAARSALAQASFDVVIASTVVMATYALQAPKRTVRIIEEHNSLTRWMEERYRGQGPSIQLLRRWASWQKSRYYEARLFSRFSLCTMVSDQDRATCLHDLPGYRGPVEVVPNGVDCRHNYPGLAQPVTNTLIYNGALSYSANYDAMQYYLAEIHPLIQQQESAVSLTITGPTSGVDLSGLRLDESTRLSGYVDDIRPLVAEAWICVVPIRRGGGTRLKILEAMALGTPVVTTSKGAEGLNVTSNRNILIADEPQEFATQVIRLLRDSALRERLSTNGRRLVEQRYDWSKIGQRFVDLVEDVASRHMREDTWL
jgi:glycosyltransferase involved in cell wall biosynthesis